MTMPVNFILVSDLHLSHPDLDDPNLHSDTVANLKLMAAKLQGMTPAPAFVVVCGDLTNQGDQASYELVRDILEPVGIPVIYALGNHDIRAAFRAVIADGAAGSDAPYYHQTIKGGLHVITLDSSLPGRVSGHICAEQFSFLELALQENPDLPKLLVIHHPPRIEEASLAWESLNQEVSDRLAEVLKGHSVAAILSGHIHFNRVSNWHGIPVIVSNGLHATVDMLRPAGMQIEGGTGFGNCTYRASGMTVSFVPLTPARPLLKEISDEALRSFS